MLRPASSLFVPNRLPGHRNECVTDLRRVLSATGAGVWVEFPLVGCIESCLVFIWDAVDSSILCARVLSATGAGVWIEFCSGGCVEICLVIVVVIMTWGDVCNALSVYT